MIVPAVVGGLTSGALSAIPVANCFCCLWIVLGAMLAVYLYCRQTQVSFSTGDGALLGILTGLIATLADFFLSIPFRAISLAFTRRFLETLAQFTEDMPAGWETWLEKGNLGYLSLPLVIFSLTMRAIIFAGLGALGGVIGVSLFGRKRIMPSNPPAPSSPPPASPE